VFALGGERQIEGHCDMKDNLPEPGERTIVIDKVERYGVDVDRWVTLADLPQGHRFRFAGVGYLDKMYTFGGQERFDLGCNCYKTTDEVSVYEEVFMTSGALNTMTLSAYGLFSAVVAGLLVLL
jgi:hypothetical protein